MPRLLSSRLRASVFPGFSAWASLKGLQRKPALALIRDVFPGFSAWASLKVIQLGTVAELARGFPRLFRLGLIEGIFGHYNAVVGAGVFPGFSAWASLKAA